jgi:hypothetical protein
LSFIFSLNLIVLFVFGGNYYAGKLAYFDRVSQAKEKKGGVIRKTFNLLG